MTMSRVDPANRIDSHRRERQISLDSVQDFQRPKDMDQFQIRFGPEKGRPARGVDLRSLPATFAEGPVWRYLVPTLLGLFLCLFILASPQQNVLAEIAILKWPSLAAGTALLLFGACRLYEDRIVQITAAKVSVRYRRVIGGRVWNGRLSDFDGPFLETVIRIEGEHNERIETHSVLLRHADLTAPLVLFQGRDRKAASDYFESAAAILEPICGPVPLEAQPEPVGPQKDLVDRVREHDPISDATLSLQQQIALGTLEFDSTPTPPPRSLHAERDGEILVITAMPPKIEEPDRFDLRSLVAQVVGKVILVAPLAVLAAVVFYFAGVGPITVSIGLALAGFALSPVFLSFMPASTERERLRVTPRRLEICVARRKGERDHYHVDTADLVAIDAGRSHLGLSLIARRRTLNFGAHLAPEALSWCRRAILAHLSTSPKAAVPSEPAEETTSP